MDLDWKARMTRTQQPTQPATLAPEVQLHLREQLRAARACVLRDAEAFTAVVEVVERIDRPAGGNGHGMTHTSKLPTHL